MQRSLTKGPITKGILLFALPLMFGNLLQQMYNIADTWVVGRFLGADALAAVGSSYTLMTFLTSILLGLCMGSGAAVSMQYGSGEEARMRQSVFQSFVLIAGMALALNVLVYLGLGGILWVLRVPEEIIPLMKEYLRIIFLGITATFLYNYFANLLRAIGNSMVPLLFLAVSAVLNVILDLVCVLVLHWGVRGAAAATTFSQFVSGIGIGLYTLKKFPQLCPKKEDCRWDKQNLATILNLSVMTSVQQSIMNFGILMVQGLVNSFGTVIMAAFAAAVKIDSFAYMPVQDFGNAFSTYVAQNYGAGQTDRIRKGIRSAGLCSAAFCIVISVLVAPLQRRSWAFSLTRRKPPSLLPVCTICTLRARAISASAFCSCSTATTGLSISPRCRWCSRSHLSAPVWRWPTCCRRPRWASPASGSVCPSAGHWPMPSALGTTSKSTGQSTRCRPETNQKRMHPLTGSIRFFIEHQIFSASMACCRCW